MSSREALESRVGAMIGDPATQQPEVRDRLIEDIARWQAERIVEYGRLERRGAWPPALPTDVFRARRIAAHPREQDVRVFESSGTTSSNRSKHSFADLRVYDSAARSAARHMLFPDVDRIELVVLAPHEREAPHSSLSYMLTRFSEWFATKSTFVWHDGAIDLAELRTVLTDAGARATPIAVLGTSFAFVHAEDGLGSFRARLPDGSRLMQTGGYKGRSREVDPGVLRTALGERYGIAESRIIAEYGMTEMSSQLYETSLRDEVMGLERPRRLWTPPWVRATPVDADTLEPVERGARGVLRIDDCANLDSVCCIQTADLATRDDDGLILEGRAPGAPPRGCSLAADQALGTA